MPDCIACKGAVAVTPAEMTPAEIANLLRQLEQAHRDLDEAIGALASHQSVDQLQLSRLKRRKLQLKDQIEYWRSKSIPDLNA